jgi:hypothetical protein
MTGKVEVRPLGEREVFGDFDAGPTAGGRALTTFLKSYAKQHQRKGLSATHLAFVEGRIAGFVTLSSISVPPEELAPVMKGLPPRFGAPALLIARMATDTIFQGQRLVGPHLMRETVFVEAAARRAGSGCLGVVTDAKPEAVRFYDRFAFVVLQSPDDPTASTRMFLPFETVQQALETALR